MHIHLGQLNPTYWCLQRQWRAEGRGKWTWGKLHVAMGLDSASWCDALLTEGEVGSCERTGSASPLMKANSWHIVALDMWYPKWLWPLPLCEPMYVNIGFSWQPNLFCYVAPSSPQRKGWWGCSRISLGDCNWLVLPPIIWIWWRRKTCFSLVRLPLHWVYIWIGAAHTND